MNPSLDDIASALAFETGEIVPLLDLEQELEQEYLVPAEIYPFYQRHRGFGHYSSR